MNLPATPESLGKVISAITQKLISAGIESARLDARLIASHATGWDVQTVLVYPEREIPHDICRSITEMARRRANREPLSHIVGQREFWSLEFKVNSDTLTPRPDTETLVECVLSCLGPERKDQPLSILDLGTGSGCILLSLLSELPEAHGLGVDISEAALCVARTNTAALGLEARAKFQQACWADGVKGSFDVVVSNPPYIPAGDIDVLLPEVSRYEPRLALDGGKDGLEAYRAITTDLARLLGPRGFACFEVGIGQAAQVGEILAESGFAKCKIHPDLAEIERVVMVMATF